jgi:hypothetical protein
MRTARNILGLVYYEQHQLEIAISEFQAAIHIDSKLAAADYNLGLALRDSAISSTAGEERAKLLEDACVPGLCGRKQVSPRRCQVCRSYARDRLADERSRTLPTDLIIGSRPLLLSSL